MTDIALAYLDALAGRIAGLKGDAEAAMTETVEAMVTAARGDHLVYVFGTGHSHMLAEEVHYRAGGLAFTVPILATHLMLHEGAIASTKAERESGLVGPILDRYPIGPDDVLVVVSNSGVNAVPVEAARIGKAIGCTVVAITSVAYSKASANGRETLAEIADIVIDNGIPAGDAIVDLPETERRSGPASTVLGAALVNAICAEVAHRLAQEGDPPVYLSANMPGAKAVNAALVARYRSRNRHL